MSLIKITKFLWSIINRGSADKEKADLDGLDIAEFNFHNLKKASAINLDQIFNSKKINKLWKSSSVTMENLSIPDGTGGVNPGDRRAIFYLIASLKPKSILEIGTHIGASTVNIAFALSKITTDERFEFVTVDIRDVNSTKKKSWLKYGTKHSPKKMLEMLRLSSKVQFITDTSLGYAKKSNQKFDFIFLDGDHTAKTVYEEISIVLRLLNPNGVILLHDFFPSCQPLWANNSIVPGPFMAVNRIIKEQKNIQVKSLGSLPWPTKLDTNITSLALILQK